jgi:hypothetical protein
MTTTRYAPRTVTIGNGRPHATEFGLDRSGFTLLGHESAVTGSGDPRTLDTVYTAEALQLVSANRAVHTLRSVAAGAGDHRTRPARVRMRRYPLFFAAKRSWVVLLDALPPGASQALTHHVQLRANDAFRMRDRRQSRRSWRCQEQAGTQADVV